MKTKITLIFPLIIFIGFLLGCRNSLQVKNIDDCEIVFAEKMMLNQNTQIFLDEYFNDSILSAKMHYYFLAILQEQDSCIFIINPIPIDLGFNDVKPNSFIKYKDKIIYISSAIDRLIDNERVDSFIKDMYKESFKEATLEYRDSHYFKRWALIINNYDNGFRIIKNSDEATEKIQAPTIKKDTIAYAYPAASNCKFQHQYAGRKR